MVGALTRFTLQELCVDKAFMGTIGLSLEEGLTTTDAGEAYTKELVMEHAREVILLADSTKVHKISFTRSGQLEKVGILVTDNRIDRKFSKELRKRGVEVRCA
jgi:DeoR/GlpR family transcriptional regulator of sugar metabolism